MAGIREFDEAWRELDPAAADESNPFTGVRVWYVEESSKPGAEYSTVGVATSLAIAQKLADCRRDRYLHGESTAWESYGIGMSGPSSYRRYTAETNIYRQWQMISQVFLNSVG